MLLIYTLVAATHPAAVRCTRPAGLVPVRVRVRHRPRRRLHDHPADGRGSVRRRVARAADGHRAHGRQCLGSGRPDAGGGAPRSDLAVTAGLHCAGRARAVGAVAIVMLPAGQVLQGHNVPGHWGPAFGFCASGLQDLTPSLTVRCAWLLAAGLWRLSSVPVVVTKYFASMLGRSQAGRRLPILQIARKCRVTCAKCASWPSRGTVGNRDVDLGAARPRRRLPGSEACSAADCA